MKPLQKLSSEDFQKNIVWKYFSDYENDDSAIVQATDLTELSESSNETYIALTHYSTADGAIYKGYCSPTDFSGLDYIQPVIIFEGKHLALWNRVSVNELSNILKKKVSDIFPILFECQVPVDGEFLKLTVTQNDIYNA